MLDSVEHRSLPETVIHRDTDDGRKRINVIDDYDGKISLSFRQLHRLATTDSPMSLR
jgi:hypothetical protein